MTGFEKDVRPLFREDDRSAMRWAFDLWSYDAVQERAETILERLEEGSMPCDDPWDEERIALFRDWIEGGCQP